MEESIKLATLPALYGEAYDEASYVVTVGYGTPKKNQTVAFDTGSDISWVQCKPCVSTCFPQREPLFNPSESSSYRNISCGSLECANLTRSGCSSGILGLGRGNHSLVTQTVKKFGGIFSYCLPSPSASSRTGHLTLGAVTKAAKNISYTPLNLDHETFYNLDLVGISVGGRVLPINASVFSNAGTIIDSGTVITRLPSSAYAALRSAFKRGMSAYQSTPSKSSLLDTCYDFSEVDTIAVPTIVFHFNGGADMEVDVSGTMYGMSRSRFCLAFAGNIDDTDLGIIGNVQQQNLEVVYDTQIGRVGFGPGSCTDDNPPPKNPTPKNSSQRILQLRAVTIYMLIFVWFLTL
ncbi:Protein ASPARTIC PROTEASE IN GUARD CELL 2 [Acorus gramineus]|uniref:Protein ASPARTIC PROTEASE IN GUARD CELL 2 n=1 Tax=Acorus gramineus TaxID=55184 RepID=A0AAV9BDD4_ACOGR|nr:Protein ASPARTIC PROTEASE IN GUARD CELL 2 [Acorus gramineus]